MVGVPRPEATPDPASDPNTPDESAQWAALEAELEVPDPILDAPNEDAPPEPRPPTLKTETETGEEPPPGEPPKPETPEQVQLRRTTAALKEARAATKRAEENLQRILEDSRANRAERERLTPRPPVDEPKIPSVEEDPIGHFQARTAMLEEALRQTYQGQRQTQEQIEAERQEQQFWNHVQASEDAARAAYPKVEVEGRQVSDYDMACEHLKNHRMAELATLYPDTSHIALAEARQYGLPSPAHLRAAILKQDAIGIAQRAWQLGIEPSQLYYETAKGRGYQPKAAAAKPSGNGQLAAHRRGQKAALTISGGEGRKSSNEMSVADLSELFIDDPDEFDKQWDRMARAGKLG